MAFGITNNPGFRVLFIPEGTGSLVLGSRYCTVLASKHLVHVAMSPTLTPVPRRGSCPGVHKE